MDLTLKSGVNRIQSALIFSVFLVFVLNAIGATDFRLMLGASINVHEEIISQLFRGNISPALMQADFIAFVLIGAVLAVLLPSLPPIGASLVTLVSMAPPLYIAWAFPYPPPIIPMEYTLLVVMILFAVNVLMSYFVETHEKQKIIHAFGQYVPPALVDEISRKPQDYSMASESRELSVLFTDIKKFSSICETLDATTVADMLNVYLTEMTDVLHQHGATIDKYIGDAIMAFWGAPMIQEDHAERAVKAALAMQARMVTLRDEFETRGWPRIEIGIGINTGTMNVGNMGSRYRMAYTVLGDAVNLAARLEALTRLYQVDVLVAEATRVATPAITYREIDFVRVKGKDKPAHIFEPLDAERVRQRVLGEEVTALKAYYTGDWDTARPILVKLRDQYPDESWYAVMLDRMRQQRPPIDWDGTVSFGGDTSYVLGAAGEDAA